MRAHNIRPCNFRSCEWNRRDAGGRNCRAYLAVAALNLATRSADTRPRSLPRCPGPLPDRNGVQPAHRCPCTQAGPGACRRAAGRHPRSTLGLARRLGMPGGPADLVPRAVQRDADSALRPGCHQGHRSAEPVLAKAYLPFALTGLALAHQRGQVKRISGSNTARLGHCKPALAVAHSSRPGSASLLVATVSTSG
jgi:hypothetical protein